MQMKTDKRVRKTDHEAIPQMALELHPENAVGIGPLQATRIHQVMFQHYMEDLRNAEVSQARRKEVWKWILDTFCRWGEQPVVAGTFRACCLAVTVSTLGTIKTLAWHRRKELDWLFGHGTHLKVYRKAEELAEPDQHHLCEEMGGRRSPEGCYRGSVPGGAL